MEKQLDLIGETKQKYKPTNDILFLRHWMVYLYREQCMKHWMRMAALDHALSEGKK